MRFIFLSPGYHPDIDGGAYRYAADLADLMASRGHEVHVITKNPENRLSEVELRRSVRLYRIDGGGDGPRTNWGNVNRDTRYRIKRLLHDSNHPTLLTSHHAYFTPALRGYGVVSVLHGPWGLEYLSENGSQNQSFFARLRTRWVSKTLHRIERQALVNSQSILVASRHTASALKQWHPKVETPVQTIGAGVNTQKFYPPENRNQLRESLGIGPKQFLFLAVRRLEPRMGLPVLIEAFKAVAPLHPGALLWIAGRGSQQESLAAQARATGLGDRIKLLGFLPERDLPEYYGAADVAVMPSLELEGFGLSTAEAMACGTPVIASKVGANVEVVSPFSEGLLFEPAPNPLAQLMNRILSGEHPLPDRASTAAHANAQFRWDTAAEVLENSWHDFAIDPEIPKRKS